MILREKQSLFSKLIAQLTLWIFEQGWEITEGEGFVQQARRAYGSNLHKIIITDAEHMQGSLHYIKLAKDINLFVDGEYITDGGNPVWTAIGRRWEQMHPLCRWGGRFQSIDANHLSLEHDGRA